MCQPHPPGPYHTGTISNESVRACIGTLENAVSSDTNATACFDYLRIVANHFNTAGQGGGCIVPSSSSVSK